MWMWINSSSFHEKHLDHPDSQDSGCRVRSRKKAKEKSFPHSRNWVRLNGQNRRERLACRWYRSVRFHGGTIYTFAIGHIELLTHAWYEYSLAELELHFPGCWRWKTEFRWQRIPDQHNKFSLIVLSCRRSQVHCLILISTSLPFRVTSSNTITLGACTGLGIAPVKSASSSESLKRIMREVGSVHCNWITWCNRWSYPANRSGNLAPQQDVRRRCGWLDLPALEIYHHGEWRYGSHHDKSLMSSVISILWKFGTEYKINGKGSTIFHLM